VVSGDLLEVGPVRKMTPSTLSLPPRVAAAISIASMPNAASACSEIGQTSSRRENRSSTVAR
jgi:hypothetical protein